MMVSSRRKTITILLIALFSSFFPGRVGSQTDEAQVKTAFIFNFLKFIEWQAPTDGGNSLTICFVGNGSFDQFIAMIDSKVINGKELIATMVPSLAQVPPECRVVFAIEDGEQRLKELKAFFKGKAILTIANEAWEPGSFIIHFFLEADKVRFGINPRLAREAGIRIDSRLLKLAKIVDE